MNRSECSHQHTDRHGVKHTCQREAGHPGMHRCTIGKIGAFKAAYVWHNDGRTKAIMTTERKAGQP